MSAPLLNLADQLWLRAAPTRAVMDALEAAGGAGCARFVGGCVRNALTGHPIDDIDIATRLAPDAVIAALKAAGLKAVPTGVAHGTVTAVAKRQPFEITTLRRDVETDGRRAVVAFTTDWGEDAQRRDFRLNALYADAEGAIFDPTGEGLADAMAGRIVFVGEAQTRIAEDALRILRFFRFYAWYGRGEADPVALAACADQRDKVRGLSAERVSKELLKLLAAPDPAPTVRLMQAGGILDQALPGHAGLARLEAMVVIDAAQGFAPDSLLRLAALLPDDAARATASAQALRLSNAQRDRLVAAAGGETIDRPPGAQDAHALIYRQGAGAFADHLRLAWSAAGASVDPAPWLAALTLGQDWTRPSFPLTGDDALAAGAARGPQVGASLKAVEGGWVAEDFAADRATLLERLRRLVEASG